MHGKFTYKFVYWADTVAHLLLLKSSMLQSFALRRYYNNRIRSDDSKQYTNPCYSVVIVETKRMTKNNVLVFLCLPLLDLLTY